jgi:iron complex outermembrane receptor protein
VHQESVRLHVAWLCALSMLSMGALPARAAEQTSDTQASSLQEVIVTAEKREELIQDVPMSLSVLLADDLVESNQLRIRDFASSVPGFSVNPTQSAGGQQALTIRGISTGFNTSPTVGVVIDDVPYGASSSNHIPDLDPSELDHVEVLRGPQGTLYGASSMGGLLKFVTRDPSTEAWSGSVQVGGDDVYNGAQAGYSARASGNIPISDTLAIRASAFTRQDPGYIDNPRLGFDGVNQQDVSGGRFAALWHPSDAFTAKVSALVQTTHGYGSSFIQIGPNLGDLQQDLFPGSGGYDKQSQAYSLTLIGKVGGITITSLTGYNINNVKDSDDVSVNLGPLSAFAFGPTNNGAVVYDEFDENKLSEELRLSASLGQQLDWVLGGYFTRERTYGRQTVYGGAFDTGSIAGLLLDLGSENLNKEYAGFANLTYHFTDRFDVQLGGRESELREGQLSGFSSFPSFHFNTTTPPFSGDESSFTFLVSPRFKVSDDLMVYARASSGFRPGAPGSEAPGQLCVEGPFPCSFAPDKTINYELGAKGSTLNKIVTFDADVFYIDWKDLQTNLTFLSQDALNPANGTQYTSNIGRAKSEGVELSAEVRPTSSFLISGWVDWNEAVLTELNLPQNAILSNSQQVGDRLPYSSRWSGNLLLEQKFGLSHGLKGAVGGRFAYFSSKVGTFVAAGERPTYPAYGQGDFYASLARGAWKWNLYVNNVTDKRAIVGGGNGVFPPNAYTVILPRTVGINLQFEF